MWTTVFLLTGTLLELGLQWEIKFLDNDNQTTILTPNFTLKFTEKRDSNKDDVPIGTAIGVTLTIVFVIVLIIIIIIMRWKKISPLASIRICNESEPSGEESEPMEDMNASYNNH